ncbi:hypothetical protein [Desulfosporosinus sp. BG]|uniref:hypothetical protein n=1 Tax=Desulfosporosinus sp. BG TaxID=1633135 RepID=UPI00083ACC0C|nr:hypothetical protein [Desulfosporosinus sp. BG]ODA41337.1 hypothetical protein DSBG_1947 [Desulfosporosinus sp. BG]
MNKQEIASLACKILGIYIIIQGINVLSSVLFVSIATPKLVAQENLVNIIFSLVYILFGVLLWIFSDKLSGIMVSRGTTSKESAGLAVGDVQRVAFSVLGLYYIGSSLPRLVSTLMSSMRGLPDSFTGFTLRGSMGTITEFTVGLGIFLGSQGLVNFLNSIRIAGLKREDD